jgi:hypothetical protein
MPGSIGIGVGFVKESLRTDGRAIISVSERQNLVDAIFAAPRRSR